MGSGLQFCDSRKLGPRVFNTSTVVSDRESQIALSVSLGRELSLFNWLRSRIDVGAAANINARICHLTESKSAALEHAHAADGAAAGRQRAAKEHLSGEIPEGQTLEGDQYRTHLRL